jgi:hypothetical protein
MTAVNHRYGRTYQPGPHSANRPSAIRARQPSPLSAETRANNPRRMDVSGRPDDMTKETQ